jgi:hypothetical protein
MFRARFYVIEEGNGARMTIGWTNEREEKGIERRDGQR